MDASILTKKYEVAPPESFSTAPDPPEMQPQGFPMDHPTAWAVGAGPTAAPFLPHSPVAIQHPEYETARKASAMAPSQPAPAVLPQQPQTDPAKVLAKQAVQAPVEKLPPGWTPERKKEADELNRMGRLMNERVTQRRTQRKSIREYEKLQSQLETSAGKLTELKELRDTYPKDDEHALPIQRRIMQHLISSERLHRELSLKAKELNKRHGFPLDKSGFLADPDAHLEQDDKQYDTDAMEALAGAYERRPAE